MVTFPVELPASTTAAEVEQWLSASGFTRVHAEREVASPTGPRQDARRRRRPLPRLGTTEKARAIEAIEVALKRGSGRVDVYAAMPAGEQVWRFSTGLHCPDSDLRYAEPQPALFSFNSAYGACETCRGFGRVIGVDFGLVIPDHRKTLRNGAIKTIQTPAWTEIQDDLLKYAGEAGIPRDTAWQQLTDAQRDWVIEGSPNWKGKWNQQWYGIRRFFGYLESKAYKMHIRVLLSKYRSYTPCPPAAARASSSRRCSGGSARRTTPTRCCRLRSASCRSAWPGTAAARGAARPHRARPDAAADRPAARLLRPARRRRGARRRPRRSWRSFTTRSAPGCATSATSASATSRSTARAAPSPAARRSGST